MSTVCSAIQLILALVALSMYLRVRKYLRIHTDEPVEEHSDWLMGRMWVICILSLVSALMGVLRLFF